MLHVAEILRLHTPYSKLNIFHKKRRRTIPSPLCCRGLHCTLKGNWVQVEPFKRVHMSSPKAARIVGVWEAYEYREISIVCDQSTSHSLQTAHRLKTNFSSTVVFI